MARVRVGQGWDIHRLVAGRPLRLSGIEVPYARGLLGHSDGDVVLHAVIDAVLGALGAGDIGQHFPDTDPRWQGIDSTVMLTEVVQLAAARGYHIGNVDVTILAEQPKLAPHAPAMRQRLATLLGVGAEKISIKAKTTEGLGAIGAGEAIGAMAVLIVSPAPRASKRLTAEGRRGRRG